MNKYQVALDYLKPASLTHVYNADEYTTIHQYLECIEELVEKEIPKIPDIEGDGYADGELVYDTWICPNCEKDYELDYDDYKYCPNCGQHIDWEGLKRFRDRNNWIEEDEDE